MTDRAQSPSGTGSPPPAPSERQATYVYQGPDLRGHAEQLRQKRREYEGMGGLDRIERQHAAGKLTVRERLELLFDPGSFTEFSLLAHHQSTFPAMQGKFT